MIADARWVLEIGPSLLMLGGHAPVRGSTGRYCSSKPSLRIPRILFVPPRPWGVEFAPSRTMTSPLCYRLALVNAPRNATRCSAIDLRLSHECPKTASKKEPCGWSGVIDGSPQIFPRRLTLLRSSFLSRCCNRSLASWPCWLRVRSPWRNGRRACPINEESN